jgi:hypothetical protein
MALQMSLRHMRDKSQQRPILEFSELRVITHSAHPLVRGVSSFVLTAARRHCWATLQHLTFDQCCELAGALLRPAGRNLTLKITGRSRRAQFRCSFYIYKNYQSGDFYIYTGRNLVFAGRNSNVYRAQ